MNSLGLAPSDRSFRPAIACFAIRIVRTKTLEPARTLESARDESAVLSAQCGLLPLKKARAVPAPAKRQAHCNLSVANFVGADVKMRKRELFGLYLASLAERAAGFAGHAAPLEQKLPCRKVLS